MNKADKYRHLYSTLIALPVAFYLGNSHASEEQKDEPKCPGSYSHMMQMHRFYLNHLHLLESPEHGQTAAASDPARLLDNLVIKPAVYRF